MKAKRILGSLLTVALAAALFGCNGGDKGATNTETNNTAATGGSNTGTFQGKDFKIAMIAKSQDNPVFQSARKGAEDAAKELSGTTGKNITVDWLTPPTEDGQEQAKRIKEAVNNGANAILISCSDAAKVTGAINDAVDGGVPVMTFDSDAPDSKRFAFYGADDEEGGKQLMDELGELTGGKGNMAILAGNQNAPNLQRRVKAVEEEAKAKYPNIKLVDVYYHKESPQDAAAEVIRAMKANPSIDCWAMVGGWPLFTTSLLTDLDPNKVKIVAWDALPAQLPYVEKGTAPILLAQPVYDWGHKSVEIIVDKLINGKDVETINKMQLVKVDKSNLSQWAQQLVDWGFDKKDLTAYLPK